MTVFLIALAVISCISTIAIGYLFPYIVLQFYAIKRKTTVKSLISLLEKHDNLSDVFALSHAESWGCGIFVIIIGVSQVLNRSVSYIETIAGFITMPILLFCSLIYIIGSPLKMDFEMIDDDLREQSIKF